VLGHWDFYGLDFSMTPDVLIPRPETELLVERALDWLRAHPGRRRVADIGTGSGCIAVSLAANVPDLRVLATDISSLALEVAKANAQKHAVSDRVQFLHADLFNFQPSTFNFQLFDLIAANLPYIPTDRLEILDVARREPRLALDGGADGLKLIGRLLMAAPGALAPGGLCLLEIDAEHGKTACALARAAFPQADVSLIPDLAGLDRLILVHSPVIKTTPNPKSDD
jgi:release factor glutamine methyltransferase